MGWVNDFDTLCAYVSPADANKVLERRDKSGTRVMVAA